MLFGLEHGFAELFFHARRAIDRAFGNYFRPAFRGGNGVHILFEFLHSVGLQENPA